MRPLPVLATAVATTAALLAIGLAACGAGSGGTGVPDRDPGPAAATGTFPRSATYWLSQNDLPSAAELARYDLVVIDSEWAHRAGRELFAEIRRLNPRVTILAYVNPVDRPLRLGSPGYYADRYALWRFRDSTTTAFPDGWAARTADGDAVSQWPETVMANLADTGPAVDGVRYPDAVAAWVVGQVWSTGLWDGVFLDVWGDTIYGGTHESWDVDGDGVDEPAGEIYGPDGPWARGLSRAEAQMRAAMPSAVLLANGDRTLSGDRLDGRVYESFADPGGGRDPDDDLAGYLAAAAGPGHREPGVPMTINVRRGSQGSDEAYRAARFQLTGTLLADGWWAPMGTDYGELAYYDELDGGGLGRGYLGRPVVPDPPPARVTGPYTGGVGAVAPDVLRRDFANGIVLHNAGPDDATVELGGTFRHLRGTQDPTVNDGATVRSVTVPAGDGLILVR